MFINVNFTMSTMLCKCDFAEQIFIYLCKATTNISNFRDKLWSMFYRSKVESKHLSDVPSSLEEEAM